MTISLPSSITGLAVVALSLLELPGSSLLGALHGCALTQDLTSSRLPQPLFLYISLLHGEPPSHLPSSACPHSTALREHTMDSCVCLFYVSSQSPHSQTQFAPKGTLGNVWKHCWWTQLVGRGGVTDIYLVRTRKAAKEPAIHRITPHRELSSHKCSQCWG